ncbi:MATE family efflux transporter [Saccharibacillus alkalitolerans]|uniref:Probable multidrug resistance protein NorM n=1 Tax=Saccharibacillus alkalitolerans TaxID=2705290 RepID=A0ABX0FE88_9BACL|nr:MATE family efflux transporter [Saccharibacillus alkalitolerans]NGZ77202.1 MATE family efflux transporter [Saccharibacillus alkalitolerans]
MAETDIRMGRRSALLDRYLSGRSIDYKQIISLFIPLLVDQIFIVGLNLVNTAMISSAGVDAVSAVNMVDSLNVFLLSIFVAVATGGTVVVAQYKGSGNANMVSRSTAGAASAVSLLALVIGLVMIVFHNPLLNLLFGSAEPAVMELARTYTIGSGISYLGIAFVEAVCGALRGIGRTRASLALSLVMNLSYVGLNLLFINGLDLGVLGMTLSVNISRYLAAACAVYYLIKIDAELRLRIRDFFEVGLDMLKRVFKIGMPFAAEQMFFNGGKILTQVFIVSMGTHAIATNAISGALAGVMQIPANALSLTLITVVGQCMGRRDVKDAKKLTKSFVVLGSFFYLLMGLIILPLFHPLIGMFNPPADIVDDIFLIVLINTVAQIPLWSISFMIPSALRAAGDAKFTSVVSMLSMWLFRVVLGYILGVVFELGILGVWLAMDCEWAIRGGIFIWRFMGRKWYRHKLI